MKWSSKSNWPRQGSRQTGMQQSHWMMMSQHPQQLAAAACRKALPHSWDRQTDAMPCTRMGRASWRLHNTQWSVGLMPRWCRAVLRTIHPAYSSTCQGAHTHNHFTALWTLSETTWVSWYQKIHFAIFWIFLCKMKITQADASTIRMDCHPIQTNRCLLGHLQTSKSGNIIGSQLWWQELIFQIYQIFYGTLVQ